MWMKGYIDRGGEFDMVDAFNSRKLRPLVPKPATSSSTSSNNMFPTINPPCFNRLQGSDNFFALNHHFHHLGEESRRELNTQPVVVSSRWNPTPEQLRTLEELYRRGTRTPSADQIQHITAQLRRFGKIEGKNVFYWFQNHKARERQKRRRQLESGNSDAETLEKKESVTGSSRTGFEGEQNKNWALPTNCSILAEEPVAVTQRAAKAVALERRTDEWLQFQSTEGILGNTRSLEERNATWKTRELSSSPTAYNLINTIAATIPTTATTETAPPAIRSVDPKLIKSTQDFSCIHRERHNEEEGQKESQTLQLFPLRCHDENGTEKETGLSIASIDLNTPQQFFEFLPLKN